MASAQDAARERGQAVPDSALRALNSPESTKAERYILRWQFHLLGDFEAALIKTLALADEDNFERLQVAFPFQARAFADWRQGDMAQRLRKRGVEV